MDKRGVLLSGIAEVLNAGGSALIKLYDAVTAITTTVLPGEKGNLRAQLREYEKKIERLYSEIGKEVVLRADTAHLSAAGEAGIKRVAEYQAEIEKIKQSIEKIEAEEKAAATQKATKERSAARVRTAPETTSKPIADAEESAVTGVPEGSSVSTEAATEAATEETKDVLAEATETPAQEMATDTAVAADAETKEVATTEVLETMLKGDLLKLCREKGIEADKRMTKAVIIELILGRS